MGWPSPRTRFRPSAPPPRPPRHRRPSGPGFSACFPFWPRPRCTRRRATWRTHWRRPPGPPPSRPGACTGLSPGCGRPSGSRRTGRGARHWPGRRQPPRRRASATSSAGARHGTARRWLSASRRCRPPRAFRGRRWTSCAAPRTASGTSLGMPCGDCRTRCARCPRGRRRCMTCCACPTSRCRAPSPPRTAWAPSVAGWTPPASPFPSAGTCRWPRRPRGDCRRQRVLDCRCRSTSSSSTWGRAAFPSWWRPPGGRARWPP